MEIKEFEQKYKGFDKMTSNEIKEMAKELMQIISDWEFIFKIEFDWKGDSREIFEFLKSKKRTSEFIENNEGKFGVVAKKMDRDFFLKNAELLLPITKYNFILEDSKKIIIIEEDGLKVKLK